MILGAGGVGGCCTKIYEALLGMIKRANAKREKLLLVMTFHEPL